MRIGLINHLVLSLSLMTSWAQAESPSASLRLLEAGWEGALFPGLELKKDLLMLDEDASAAIRSEYGIAPVSGPVEVFFAHDGSGNIKGGLLLTRVAYLGGQFTLAVGLNDEYRIAKVVIPESDAGIHQAVRELAPRGVVTRYTVVSLRQVQYIAKSMQGHADLGGLLAQEVLRVSVTLTAAMKKRH